MYKRHDIIFNVSTWHLYIHIMCVHHKMMYTWCTHMMYTYDVHIWCTMCVHHKMMYTISYDVQCLNMISIYNDAATMKVPAAKSQPPWHTVDLFWHAVGLFWHAVLTGVWSTAKETYYISKETYYISKKTYYISKETYNYQKRPGFAAHQAPPQGCALLGFKRDLL